MKIPVITPRPYQLPFWNAMDSGAKHAILSNHRRGGKDVTCFSYTVREALKVVGTYYYCFPTLELGKEILWDNITTIDGKSGYMVDLLCPPEYVVRKHNQDHYVQLINGSIIRMKGTDGGKVFGNDGRGFIFTEWQSHKPEIYDFIRPILRQNDGWSIFNGTMRGMDNHLYKDIQRNKHVPGWYTEWLTPEDTKAYYWITPESYPEEYKICINPELEGKIDPITGKLFRNIQWEVDSGMSYSLARQEYLNEAVSHVEGSYYSFELSEMKIKGRTKAEWNPEKPVYTFWDLGGVRLDSDKTTITFAQMDSCDSDVFIIDYYENTGKLRGHYIDYMSTKPYRYGGHFIPHDGKRSNTWTGEGMAETAKSMYGLDFRYVPKSDLVINDIEIVRRDFKKFHLDMDSCRRLFGHLSRYHASESTGKPCHRNNCVICSGASHGADSVRMMSMARHLGLVEPYIVNRPKRKTKMEWDNEYIIV